MKISREFILGDHTLNSHDLSDGLSIDIRRKISCYLLFGLKVTLSKLIYHVFMITARCFPGFSRTLLREWSLMRAINYRE